MPNPALVVHRIAAPPATGKSVVNGRVVYKDNLQPIKGHSSEDLHFK